MNYYGEENEAWMNDQCGDDVDNTFDWMEDTEEDFEESPIY